MILYEDFLKSKAVIALDRGMKPGDMNPHLKPHARDMLLDPRSHSPWVWDDVVRMRTLNSEQSRKRMEQHVCPLQIDVVERLIERYSQPGELVLDPFAGLGTVPYVAVKKGRRGLGIELNATYFMDAVSYCRSEEQKVMSPALRAEMPYICRIHRIRLFFERLGWVA